MILHARAMGSSRAANSEDKRRGFESRIEEISLEGEDGEEEKAENTERGNPDRKEKREKDTDEDEQKRNRDECSMQ